MKKIKVLNLYAGIGGNRKLWPDDLIEVTAVEKNPKIAEIYKDFFPQDDVIIADAHQFLLNNYKEYDFIWSSPPCPTHSRTNVALILGHEMRARYPDMQLYEEIILLKHFFSGKWVIENVISYYNPLIKPKRLGRHYYWSNFVISEHRCFKINDEMVDGSIAELEKHHGIDLSEYDNKLFDKNLALRNCVNPKQAEHIFNCAFKDKQKTLK